jgi:hypothetical protein
VQSFVESLIAALGQSSILLLPSTYALVSDPKKENKERKRSISSVNVVFFFFFFTLNDGFIHVEA